jgi:hypothetical protein
MPQNADPQKLAPVPTQESCTERSEVGQSPWSCKNTGRLVLIAAVETIFIAVQWRLCAHNSGAILQYALLLSALLLILFRFVFYLRWGGVVLVALFFTVAYTLMPCAS